MLSQHLQLNYLNSLYSLKAHVFCKLQILLWHYIKCVLTKLLQHLSVGFWVVVSRCRYCFNNPTALMIVLAGQNCRKELVVPKDYIAVMLPLLSEALYWKSYTAFCTSHLHTKTYKRLAFKILEFPFKWIDTFSHPYLWTYIWTLHLFVNLVALALCYVYSHARWFKVMKSRSQIPCMCTYTWPIKVILIH